MNGYSPVKEFYVPGYNTAEVTAPDYRTTIYWKPDIVTDATGKATVVFYNSGAGKYHVKAEGISGDGKIGSVHISYTVK